MEQSGLLEFEKAGGFFAVIEPDDILLESLVAEATGGAVGFLAGLEKAGHTGTVQAMRFFFTCRNSHYAELGIKDIVPCD